MIRVLFLCTGNACRSQMAEGWMRHYVQQEALACEVASAGIVAHGLNPTAVQVMAECSIDISRQVSKTVDEVDLDRFSLVVTVCGDADEQCPVLGSTVRKIHWPLADPAKITGTESIRLDGFRRCRDEIRIMVAGLVGDFD